MEQLFGFRNRPVCSFWLWFGFFLSFDDDFPLSPEDKRKIVQIDDTSTKFRIRDPLHVDDDLR